MLVGTGCLSSKTDSAPERTNGQEPPLTDFIPKFQTLSKIGYKIYYSAMCKIIKAKE